MSRKVYVISKGSHDYEPARQFGELVFLSDEAFDPIKVNSMFKKFNTFLNMSAPDDLLLVTGLPIMVGVATGIMAAKHGCVNFLLFKNNRYFERTILVE